MLRFHDGWMDGKDSTEHRGIAGRICTAIAIWKEPEPHPPPSPRPERALCLMHFIDCNATELLVCG